MTAASDHPGVAAPPPLIFVGFLVVGLGVDLGLGGPGLGLDGLMRGAIGGPLIVMGVALIVAAVGRFRWADTNPEPWKPATALVVTGVYRRTRNPMYLGMTLIYVGLAVVANSLIALVLILPLLWAVRRGVIDREERYMAAKFGAEYAAYRTNVRRWI